MQSLRGSLRSSTPKRLGRSEDSDTLDDADPSNHLCRHRRGPKSSSWRGQPTLRERSSDISDLTACFPRPPPHIPLVVGHHSDQSSRGLGNGAGPSVRNEQSSWHLPLSQTPSKFLSLSLPPVDHGACQGERSQHLYHHLDSCCPPPRWEISSQASSGSLRAGFPEPRNIYQRQPKISLLPAHTNLLIQID